MEGDVIVLKVEVPDIGVTKAVRFEGMMLVTQAIEAILDKVAGTDKFNLEEYGIFQTPSGEVPGRWLDKEKTLAFYDLENGITIEYRKKIRRQKVMLMDESVKTIFADVSAPVSVVIASICERVGIPNAEEYGIKPQIDGPTAPDWLQTNLNLDDQNVGDDTVLMLKKKFFFSDKNVETTDPVEVHLLYVQGKQMIISGEHPCSLEEAVQLAGLQMQATYLDYNPAKHKPGQIDLEEVLPPMWRKVKNIDKQVISEFKKLRGVSELNSKTRYLLMARSLKTFGITMFDARERIDEKKKKTREVLIGVTREAVMRLDPNSKEVLKNYAFTKMRRWRGESNVLSLDFGDYEKPYQCTTEDAEEISKLIAGYIDIIAQKRLESQQKKRDVERQHLAKEESVNYKQAQSSQSASQSALRSMQSSANLGSQPGMLGGQMKVGISSGPAAKARVAQEHLIGNELEGDLGQVISFVETESDQLGSYIPGSFGRELDNAFNLITMACAEFSSNKADMTTPEALSAARQRSSIAPENARQAIGTGAGAVTASCSSFLDSMKDNKENLLSAVQGVAAATAMLVSASKASGQNISEGTDADMKQRLAEGASRIAQLTAKLVMAARDAQYAGDDIVESCRTDLIGLTTELTRETSELLGNTMKAFAMSNEAGGAQALSYAASRNAAMDLVNATKMLNDATARLLNSANSVAEAIDDDMLKERIVGSARYAATTLPMLTSAAIAQADDLALGRKDEESKMRFMTAARAVGGATSNVVFSLKHAIKGSEAIQDDSFVQQEIAMAALAVKEAMRKLVESAKLASEAQKAAVVDFVSASQKLAEATGNVINNIENADALEGLADDLTKFSDNLYEMTEIEAGKYADGMRDRMLLDCAQGVRDATARLVDSVNAVAVDGEDPDELISNAGQMGVAIQDLLSKAKLLKDQEAVISASQHYNKNTKDLITAVTDAVQNTEDQAAKQQVGQTAKPALVASSELIAAVDSEKNDRFNSQIVAKSREATTLSNLLQNAAKQLAVGSTNYSTQQKLLAAVNHFQDASKKLVAATRALAQDIGEEDVSIVYNSARRVLISSSEMATMYAGKTDTFINASRAAASHSKDMIGVCHDFDNDAMINAAKALAKAISTLITNCRDAAENLENQKSHTQVATAASQVEDSVKEITKIVQASYPSSTPTDLASTGLKAAIELLELGAKCAVFSVASKYTNVELVNSSREMTSSLTSVVGIGTESTNQGDLFAPATDFASNLSNLTTAANKVSTSTENTQLSANLTEAARKTQEASNNLLSTAKVCHGSVESKLQLNNESIEICGYLSEVVGQSKAISSAREIEEVVAADLGSGELKYYDEALAAQRGLEVMLKQISDASEGGDTQQVVAATSTAATQGQQLRSIAKKAAAGIDDETSSQLLQEGQKAITQNTKDLIGAARAVYLAEEGAGEDLNKAIKEVRNTAQNIVDTMRGGDSSQAADAEIVVNAKALATGIGRLMAVAGTGRGKKEEVLGANDFVALSSAQLNAAGETLMALIADKEVRKDMKNGIESVSASTKTLGNHAKAASRGEANLERLHNSAKALAEAVTRLVKSGRSAAVLMSASAGEEEVKDAAERELMNAAKAIESVADRLAKIRPPPIPSQATDEEKMRLQLSANIIEVAKAITIASKNLVEHARKQQHEFGVAAKTDSAMESYINDPNRIRGLVGVAKGVASAVAMLVGAANDASQGKASEEMLIAAANQVSATTAQLVTASWVKATVKSAAIHQERLEEAARMVRNATKRMVESAQSSLDRKVEEEAQEESFLDLSSTAKTAKSLEAQIQVLQLETQLRKARERVNVIHKSKYGAKKKKKKKKGRSEFKRAPSREPIVPVKKKSTPPPRKPAPPPREPSPPPREPSPPPREPSPPPREPSPPPREPSPPPREPSPPPREPSPPPREPSPPPREPSPPPREPSPPPREPSPPPLEPEEVPPPPDVDDVGMEPPPPALLPPEPEPLPPELTAESPRVKKKKKRPKKKATTELPIPLARPPSLKDLGAPPVKMPLARPPSLRDLGAPPVKKVRKKVKKRVKSRG